MKKSFLIAYGMGGCWVGYPKAVVVEAADDEEAEDIGLHLAAAERTSCRGGSFDLDEVTSSVEDLPLYKCRLKLSAKEMLNAARGAP